MFLIIYYDKQLIAYTTFAVPSHFFILGLFEEVTARRCVQKIDHEDT